MLAHPAIPLPEVFVVAPTLLRVHVVKHNKSLPPRRLGVGPQSAKVIRPHDGFYSEAPNSLCLWITLGSNGLPMRGGCLGF